jgi:hypothetical protein
MSTLDQFRDAAMYLAIFVVAAPPIFIAADWLRSF